MSVYRMLKSHEMERYGGKGSALDSRGESVGGKCKRQPRDSARSLALSLLPSREAAEQACLSAAVLHCWLAHWLA